MHKAIIYFTAVVFMLCMSSCEEVDLEFSCDPAIDSFIKEHRAELAEICVDELLTYSIAVQKAIFANWDYQKKREIWLEKVYYVYAAEDLNQLESDHIQSLIDHIAGDYFIDDYSGWESRAQFAQNWIEYAEEELNWSKSYISFIVFRLYLEPEQLFAEESALESLGKKAMISLEFSACECHLAADFCGSNIDCLNSDCNIISGCGWLWSMPCDGKCDGL